MLMNITRESTSGFNNRRIEVSIIVRNTRKEVERNLKRNTFDRAAIAMKTSLDSPRGLYHLIYTLHQTTSCIA